MQSNPYEILGVKETDTLEHIEHVYKQFMKLLHPDKANTQEARNLKMGQDEKSEYLILIRNAYNTIISVRRETKYPDYKMEYKVDQESRINVDKSFMEDDGVDFKEKFNKKFNQGLERDKKAGIVDAFGRGYGDFDTGKKYSDEGKVAMPAYSPDIDVEASKIFHRPNAKDNRLVEYLPDSGFGNLGMDYQELGLTNVSDFSMTLSGKGGIGGADLMSVYGNNYEPWEQTVMRDPKLSAKFTDEGDVRQRMAQMEADRGGIYDLPIDHAMMEAERARNFTHEQQEKMRMANKSYRDEYYNELNKGRLNDGVPPRSNQKMPSVKLHHSQQPIFQQQQQQQSMPQPIATRLPMGQQPMQQMQQSMQQMQQSMQQMQLNRQMPRQSLDKWGKN
jgi:curved DNA-binding protein CbpA